MVRSFEKHLYLNFRIWCKHSRVIVLYAATSSLYHHMHPCPPLPISTHSPSLPKSIPLPHPTLPSHIHPLTLPVQQLHCCVNDNMELLVTLEKKKEQFPFRSEIWSVIVSHSSSSYGRNGIILYNVLVSFIHTLTVLCVFSQRADMPELALKTSHHVNHTSK